MDGSHSSHSDGTMEHASAGCGMPNCDGSAIQTCEGSCMHSHDRGGMHGGEGGGMHERGGMGPYLDMGRTMWELQESALHQLAEVAEKKKLQVETENLRTPTFLLKIRADDIDFASNDRRYSFTLLDNDLITRN